MTKLTVRMPAKERAKLADDEELNVMQAAYYLGIGRTTLGKLVELGAVKHTRLSERNIRIRVGDLKEYEAAQTAGGPQTKTTTGAKK